MIQFVLWAVNIMCLKNRKRWCGKDEDDTPWDYKTDSIKYSQMHLSPIIFNSGVKFSHLWKFFTQNLNSAKLFKQLPDKLATQTFSQVSIARGRHFWPENPKFSSIFLQCSKVIFQSLFLHIETITNIVTAKRLQRSRCFFNSKAKQSSRNGDRMETQLKHLKKFSD